MNRKIALLMGEVTGNFQETIARAIAARANELGYDMVAFCTYGSYNDDILFSEGEKACVYLPNYEEFSGIIVTEDVFDIEGMGDEVYAHLKQHAKCPVVYLRTKREGFYSVLLENKQPMKNMTRHFLEDHGFRDICYMSGKKELWDSAQRLEGFLEAMEEKGIPVTEHMIFHGDYWREKGKVAIDWFMEGRDTYPQAIICANDYMALSICEELRERGVNVPEDVCVSGFDYVYEAKFYQPSITSIFVDFPKMGAMAVDIIDRVNRGLPQEQITRMTPDLKLQKSCGCGEQWTFDDVAEMIDQNYQNAFSMKNIMLSTMEYQDAFEENEYLRVAEKYFSLMHCDKVWLCLCDEKEEGFLAVENENRFTRQVVLKRVLHSNKNADKRNFPFSRTDLLPREFWRKDAPNNLLVFSLHYKNKIYGYLVAEMPRKTWPDIYCQSYIQNLANAIENAMVQRELSSFEEIKALYQKDSLTGLYNRRGADKLTKEMFAKAGETGTELILVSIDMDGLKYINDTYGHTEGDKAISKMGAVLQSAVHEKEVCARVGGDEFFCILLSEDPDREKQFLSQLEKSMEEANEKGGLYSIGASVGFARSMETPGMSLLQCLQLADMRMYENKRKRKVARGQSV